MSGNIFAIKWNIERGCWTPLLPVDYGDVEVIGNVWENPELLDGSWEAPE